jgi:CRP-like cAMP-binding protein
MSQIDIFQGYPIEKAKEFLLIVKEEKYKRGEQIIAKGTLGDKFYIIASGNVKFEGLGEDKDTPIKRYGTYEYFGEASLILNTTRQADVIAETDVVALTIEKSRFLQFIRGSDLKQNLERLNEVRESNSWKTIMASKSFKGATSHQITQLELIMFPESFPAHTALIRENETFNSGYIIREGSIEVFHNGSLVKELGVGDFVGEIFHLTKKLPSTYTFVTKTSAEVYTLEQDLLVQYLKKNPGVYMRMNTVYE